MKHMTIEKLLIISLSVLLFAIGYALLSEYVFSDNMYANIICVIVLICFLFIMIYVSFKNRNKIHIEKCLKMLFFIVVVFILSLCIATWLFHDYSFSSIAFSIVFALIAAFILLKQYERIQKLEGSHQNAEKSGFLNLLILFLTGK